MLYFLAHSFMSLFLDNLIKPPYLHRQGGKKIENLHKKSANCCLYVQNRLYLCF